MDGPVASRINAAVAAVLVSMWFVPARVVRAASPDTARMLNHRGVLLEQQGLASEALRCFQRARRLDPTDDRALANSALAMNNLGVRQFEQQRFHEAHRTLQQAVTLLPENVDLRLNLLGVQLALGEVAAAGATLRVVLALRPRDDQVRLAAGRAYARIGAYDEARQLFEAVLESQPRLTRAWWALARLHDQHGQMVLARKALERLLEVEPGHLKGRELLAQVQREERMLEDGERHVSDHFTVFSENDLDGRWGRQLVEVLEDAWRDLGDAFGCHPEGRVPVIVLSRSGFRQMLAVPDWAGGLYDGKIRLPVTGGSHVADASLEQTVRHEYTHHVVQILTRGRCPAWLNEGLAQTMEDARRSPAGDVLGGRPTPDLLVRLTEKMVRPEDRKGTARNYAWSLLATRTLIDRVGMSGIQRLLRHLGEQLSLEDALYRVSGWSPTELMAETIRRAEADDAIGTS